MADMSCWIQFRECCGDKTPGDPVRLSVTGVTAVVKITYIANCRVVSGRVASCRVASRRLNLSCVMGSVFVPATDHRLLSLFIVHLTSPIDCTCLRIDQGDEMICIALAVI